MKSIKRYLKIALTITFCASLNIFTMEPTEAGSMSGESGTTEEMIQESANIDDRTKNLLRARIKKLKDIINMINNTFKYEKISIRERKELAMLQQRTQDTLTMTSNMLLGIIPVNTNLIIQKVELIISEWNKIESSYESSSY